MGWLLLMALGDLQKGEYVLEIVANYSQGKAYYGIKIVVE